MSEPKMSNTYLSWAFVLAVAGALAWHYAGRPNLFARFTSSSTINPTESASNARSRRKARPKKDGNLDEKVGSNEINDGKIGDAAGDAPSGKKRKTATKSSTDAVSPQPYVSSINKDADDAINNNTFAEQFVKARTGTPLDKPAKGRPSKKERRANKTVVESSSASPAISTEPSSATGAEADDDLSPIASPTIDANNPENPRAGDVADMLEPTKGGPGVIRLTGELESSRKQNSKPQSYQVIENKKKRQARLKREQQRLNNEAAEAERRRLMEQQLRTARMASGTSNQAKVDAFKPVQNVWTQKKQAEAPLAQPAETQTMPLLDTFENVNAPQGTATSTGKSNDEKMPKIDDSTHIFGSASRGENVDTETVVAKAQDVPAREIDARSKLQPKPTDNNLPNTATMATLPNGKGGSRTQDAPLAQHSSEEKLTWADDLPTEEEQMRRLRASENEWSMVSNKKDKKRNAKVPDEDGLRDGKPNGQNASNGISALSSAPPSKISTTSNGNGFASLALPTDSQLNESDWEA
ncbi:MAG: hypothetical protein Q9227_005978 [Pyrenula ochraceoflavens]